MIKKKIVLSFLFLSNFLIGTIYAQEKLAENRYWVQLTDKNNSNFSIQSPDKFLSKNAIERRQKYKIPIIENDLPVNKAYVHEIEALGVKVLNTSKWFNSVIIECFSDTLLNLISKLNYVTQRSKVKTIISEPTSNLSDFKTDSNTPLKHWNDTLYQYGSAENQIMMLNGHLLHNNGYRGNGMTIAVIDGGFSHVDDLPAFDSIRENKQILGAIDFAYHKENVYRLSDHGMKCLSTIAGNIPGKLIGTAPKAKFWLLRSEETESENLVEEANWIAAAEFADSVGVDIISSSLGYYKFDIPTMNHLRKDCDGQSIASLGADMAASKGILVVNSAGNEGNDQWKHITIPSDGRFVLCIGAVDFAGNHAYFSSYGPSSDGRIKPDVCARGVSAAVQSTSGSITKSNGTSFSCPITAGMVACLWQAFPNLSNIDIMNLIRKSSSQYFAPDSILGFGIPDFAKAFELMNTYSESSIYNQKKQGQAWIVYPNPFVDLLELQFKINSFNNDQIKGQKTSIQINDFLGQIVLKYQFSSDVFPYFKLPANDLASLVPGVYILQINSGYGSGLQKIIKNK